MYVYIGSLSSLLEENQPNTEPIVQLAMKTGGKRGIKTNKKITPHPTAAIMEDTKPAAIEKPIYCRKYEKGFFMIEEILLADAS